MPFAGSRTAGASVGSDQLGQRIFLREPPGESPEASLSRKRPYGSSKRWSAPCRPDPADKTVRPLREPPLRAPAQARRITAGPILAKHTRIRTGRLPSWQIRLPKRDANIPGSRVLGSRANIANILSFARRQPEIRTYIPGATRYRFALWFAQAVNMERQMEQSDECGYRNVLSIVVDSTE